MKMMIINNSFNLNDFIFKLTLNSYFHNNGTQNTSSWLYQAYQTSSQVQFLSGRDKKKSLAFSIFKWQRLRLFSSFKERQHFLTLTNHLVKLETSGFTDKGKDK
jgi:hypothetical protein